MGSATWTFFGISMYIPELNAAEFNAVKRSSDVSDDSIIFLAVPSASASSIWHIRTPCSFIFEGRCTLWMFVPICTICGISFSSLILFCKNAGIAPSLLAAIFTISGSMRAASVYFVYRFDVSSGRFSYVCSESFLYLRNQSDSFFNEDISDIKSESSFASIVCDMSSHVTSLQSRPFLILSVGLIPRHIPWGALW